MPRFKQKPGPPGIAAVAIALAIAFGFAGASWERLFAQDRKAAGAAYSKRMADGKSWTTQNLNVKTVPSYCYGDAERNCSQYGRLYTWESARQGCESLGDGWRLPEEEEWRQLAEQYGGVHEDANDGGKAAYKALLSGGGSGFSALLGGGRSGDARYARLEAHGFYWTASESGPSGAWFYNFAKGGLSLYRQSEGGRDSAFSVRCVKE